MKMIKLFGISAVLAAVVLMASGCSKFSCRTGECAPAVVDTCAPCGY